MILGVLLKFKTSKTYKAYLSKLIAHKLNIEAVHSNISNDIQILHNSLPDIHFPEKKNYYSKIKEFCSIRMFYNNINSFRIIISSFQFSDLLIKRRSHIPMYDDFSDDGNKIQNMYESLVINHRSYRNF